MRSLDEVIALLEDPRRADAPVAYKDDLLKYLKIFRTNADELHALIEDYRREIKGENPPLTWDELRNMAGKPVFLEIYDGDGKNIWSGWEIVTEINGGFLVTHKDDYAQDEHGKIWQAYRKETQP